jgi:eukaryotic-like serine/threonine-protein kinase
LNTKYDVPHKLAQAWVDADMVLPLLDGLDEVTVEHRAACAKAINAYRLQEAEAIVPLAVCSRVTDYTVLTTKLRLQGAVVVQPLTPQQVDAYFERIGEKLAVVRAMLSDDTELEKMLDTPLILGIVALAYAEKSVAELQTNGTAEERRRHLFDAYIVAMFKRRSKETHYTEHQTKHWLSWLAKQMTSQNQTIYFIERMQADLLSNGLKWQPSVIAALFAGMLFSFFSFIITYPIYGLPSVFFGLFVFIVCFLIAYVKRSRWLKRCAG